MVASVVTYFIVVIHVAVLVVYFGPDDGPVIEVLLVAMSPINWLADNHVEPIVSWIQGYFSFWDVITLVIRPLRYKQKMNRGVSE